MASAAVVHKRLLCIIIISRKDLTSSASSHVEDFVSSECTKMNSAQTIKLAYGRKVLIRVGEQVPMDEVNLVISSCTRIKLILFKCVPRVSCLASNVLVMVKLTGDVL